MSTQPARRPASPPYRHPRARRAPAHGAAPPAIRLERRRRITHLRRRRRDLLVDVVIAIVLMGLGLMLTPGLGVLAIVEVPLALALVGTMIAERRFRRRRRAE